MFKRGCRFLKRVASGVCREFVSLLPKRIVQVPVYVPVLKGELLKGRHALITGGTSGIGLAMANAFVQHGARVVITGRSEERIKSVLDKIRIDGISGMVLDNSKCADFGLRIDAYAEQHGLPDILVNNAGQILCEKFGSTKIENYDEIMDVNLRGSYFLSQEMANRWKKMNVRGNILNVGSSSSLRPGNSPYVLSKWGLRSMTIGLAKELVKDGIVVNGIAPGPTATKMFVGSGENGINWPKNPTGRLATEDEIANLAVVLASDLSRMVVGDMLFVTGGAGVITVDDL